MRLSSFRPRAGLRAALCLLLCVSVTNSQVPAPVPSDKPDAYPAWWFSQSITPRRDPTLQNPSWQAGDYRATEDYAVLNQGQLKTLATAAYDELGATLAGGAWDTAAGMVKGWYLPDALGALPPPGARTPSGARVAPKRCRCRTASITTSTPRHCTDVT